MVAGMPVCAVVYHCTMHPLIARALLVVLLAAFGYVAAQGGTSPQGGIASTAQIAPLQYAASASSTQQIKTGPTLHTVVRVVDGDTIVVDVHGVPTKVRLIGLDTPEAVDPRKSVQCFGEEASQEAHRMLDGQSVRLESDPSQDTYDKYGRTLAYVFLQDGTLFNKYMITEGFGHEYTYRIPYTYQSEFKTAQREARAAGKGLWAPGACANYSP